MYAVRNGKPSPLLEYVHKHISGSDAGHKKLLRFVDNSLKNRLDISAVERLRSSILSGKGIGVATTTDDIPSDCLDLGLGPEWGDNQQNVVSWWTDRLIETMFLKTYHLLNLPLDDMKNIKAFLDRATEERKMRKLIC